MLWDRFPSPRATGKDTEARGGDEIWPWPASSRDGSETSDSKGSGLWPQMGKAGRRSRGETTRRFPFVCDLDRKQVHQYKGGAGGLGGETQAAGSQRPDRTCAEGWPIQRTLPVRSPSLPHLSPCCSPSSIPPTAQSPFLPFPSRSPSLFPPSLPPCPVSFALVWKCPWPPGLLQDARRAFLAGLMVPGSCPYTQHLARWPGDCSSEMRAWHFSLGMSELRRVLFLELSLWEEAKSPGPLGPISWIFPECPEQRHSQGTPLLGDLLGFFCLSRYIILPNQDNQSNHFSFCKIIEEIEKSTRKKMETQAAPAPSLFYAHIYICWFLTKLKTHYISTYNTFVLIFYELFLWYNF